MHALLLALNAVVMASKPLLLLALLVTPALGSLKEGLDSNGKKRRFEKRHHTPGVLKPPGAWKHVDRNRQRTAA